MEYGFKGNGRTTSHCIRHMVFGQRRGFLIFGKPMYAFADLGQRANIVIDKFSVQNEAAQRISLPYRAVFGPF